MIGRRFLLAGAAVALVRPARASTGEVAAAIAALTKGATPQQGLVVLDLAPMVENGNAVAVRVEAPPGHGVSSLHLFADGNPLPEVFHAWFGPAAFAPRLATRIRLANSQTVTALALGEGGQCWTDSVTVMVTLAACLE